MEIERFYWIGTNKEGKQITTMTIKNEAPKELIIYGMPSLGILDEIYTNFIPQQKKKR
jgi:hypothetical protein